jgi:hypothetical protein
MSCSFLIVSRVLVRHNGLLFSSSSEFEPRIPCGVPLYNRSPNVDAGQQAMTGRQAIADELAFTAHGHGAGPWIPYL